MDLLDENRVKVLKKQLLIFKYVAYRFDIRSWASRPLARLAQDDDAAVSVLFICSLHWRHFRRQKIEVHPVPDYLCSLNRKSYT